MTATKSPPFLPYGLHCTDQADVDAVAQTILNRPLTGGPAIDGFERGLAEATHADHAVVVSSGTAALHLACLAAGLGPGLAAIVPTITFVATANAVRLTGADVIFSDVDPESGLMRPQDLARALTNNASGIQNVKAVFPVHMGGWSADVEEISKIAQSHDMTIIEDASHALGSRDAGGNHAGACAYSDMCVFSFHPVKTIAMGEGGAITTTSAELAARLRRLRAHGIEKNATFFTQRDLGFDPSGAPNPWYYEQLELGLNYRASDIACALGISQLAKLDGFVKRRLELSALYDDLLRPFADRIATIHPKRGGTPGRHLYTVLIDFPAFGTDRATTMRMLVDLGIGTQVHYIPVPWQPYHFRAGAKTGYPGAAAYYERCLSLPLYPTLETSDVERVVGSLLRVLNA